MRWFWVDQFTEFQSGQSAAGIKNVSLDQEAVDDYSLAYPMFPPTLVIEGLAQLGGILLHEHFDFTKRVVLAKIGSVKYHGRAQPGDQIHYRVQLGSTSEAGATVTATSHIAGRLHAEADLMFAFLAEGMLIEGPLFEPGDLKTMLRLMSFFDVAKSKSGDSLLNHPNL